MTPDTLFLAANTTALLGWIVLLFAPLAPRITNAISGYVLPFGLSVLYTSLVIVYFRPADGGFDTLDNVVLLFTQRELVLVGWVHYLAFDLFIGAWEVRTARRVGIPFWMVLPCLPFTFLLGPVGLFLFLLLWAVWTVRQKRKAHA